MTGTLEDTTLSSRDEILAKFMEFLPKQLCIRLLVGEGEAGMHMGYLDILYVSLVADEVVHVRDTAFSDPKMYLHPANYQRRFGKAQEYVEERLAAWLAVANAPSADPIAKLHLQPKPYVGLWKRGSTVAECKAADPRFMFFYALFATRIEMTIKQLHHAKDVHKGVQRDLRALEHLGQRFNVFVSQNYQAMLASSETP